MQYIHAVLHRALEQARKWELVDRNVAGLVDPPRVPKREARALTVEEARRLLDAVEGDRYEAFYRVALMLGLRRGEALALRWEDVDLEAGTPHELRHSAASLLLAQGVDQRTIMEILRHSTIRMTADLYTHIVGPQLREAMERMDEALG